MGSFQNHSQDTSRKNIPSRTEKARYWKPIPPPNRGQRPRPKPTPQRPSSGYRLPEVTPERALAAETAALRHQLQMASLQSPHQTVSSNPTLFAGPTSALNTAGSEQTSGMSTDDLPPKRPLLRRWTLGALLLLAALGGIAGASTVSLLRIPNLPNCRAIFWPTASASTRLQCADAYAEQSTVDDLLAAITLVEVLPGDHPLRPDINKRVEAWASQVLEIADRTFHDGDLDQATRVARRIPRNTAAADEVSDRINAWKAVWEQAESIFKESEEHLKASRFREAFSAATQLREVDNEHWSSTRYDELVELITVTRSDINTLADAKRHAEGGTVDLILESLEKIAAITSESYAYEEAQRLLKELSRDLLDRAEDALARADKSQAMNILNKIPAAAELSAEIADFRTLADAYELTWAGTTGGYESGIVRLQSLTPDRPLYNRAQTLKRGWQWRLEAVAQLNWARQIARPGTVADLRAAISEANSIGASSPIWDEVQDQIWQWQTTIAEIEDRPFLDQAKVTANAGDRASLQAAIAEANQIPAGSAIYGEVEAAVADWRWQIQTIDNRPVLAEARQLADTGNLAEAITVAARIPANQAVYEDAQTAIAEWTTQQQAAQAAREAAQAEQPDSGVEQPDVQQYQAAVLVSQSGTVDALVEAIALAQTIPESSLDWSAAQQDIDQWSWELLRIAKVEAEQDRGQGIAIAAQIPPRTQAYAEAQLRILDWQKTEVITVP